MLQKQWKVKLSKCDFAKQEIAYLGHVISNKGVSTNASKITTVKNWPVPVNVKQVRRFLGLTGYYRKFIKNYGNISRPLTDMLKKGVSIGMRPSARQMVGQSRCYVLGVVACAEACQKQQESRANFSGLLSWTSPKGAANSAHPRRRVCRQARG